MFEAPDDWTPEALDCAKAELSKRGIENPQERAAPEPQTVGRDDNPDVYTYFGTYSNEDARLLLEAFVSAEVHYTLNVDEMKLANMSAFQAAYGGTFGTGVGIAIGVRADDCGRAMEIRQRVLKIVT